MEAAARAGVPDDTPAWPVKLRGIYARRRVPSATRRRGVGGCRAVSGESSGVIAPRA